MAKRIFYSAKLSGFGATPYPFDSVVTDFKEVVNPDQMDDDRGILCLWGGEDISPAMYGQKANRYVGSGMDMPSRRDLAEEALFHRAFEMKMPILGICRGAQLGCVLSGGSLVQHVDGHGGNHRIFTNKGEEVVTSSVHHQQMYPWNTDFELIAWAKSHGRNHTGEKEEPIHFPELAYDEDSNLKEPEVCYFPKTKLLAVQGHPEFMRNAPFIGYVNGLITEKFGDVS